MQDILVYVSLTSPTIPRETLLPLILTMESAAAYKEYTRVEDVAVDFAAQDSPTVKTAQAIFAQVGIGNAPGTVERIAIFGLASSSAPADITTALDTLRETNDDWYYLLPVAATDAQIIALAEWADATVLTEEQLTAGYVESEKLLLCQTTSKTIITDAVKQLRQTVVCYNHDAANCFIPQAWVGRVAPNYPKSVTWKWKELVGITPTDERGTDLQALLEAGYNLYVDENKRQYMAEGVCTDGTYIDVAIARWQIKSLLRENLVNLFVDHEIVPYDDNGFALVAQAVYTAMNDAVSNGIILEENGLGAYNVQVPVRDDATDDQIARRVMPPIYWDATLRGGVHGIKVHGTLTVSMVTTA